MGPCASDRSEFDLSQTPGSLNRAAPLIGQDTELVLQEIICVTDEEYRTLAEEGVLD